MRTMLTLARAQAYDQGIQQVTLGNDVKVIGYGLLFKEIKQIYIEQGFTSPTVCSKHLGLWKSAGLVKTYYNDKFVFFIPPITDIEQIGDLRIEAEQDRSLLAILSKGVEA